MQLLQMPVVAVHVPPSISQQGAYKQRVHIPNSDWQNNNKKKSVYAFLLTKYI